MKQLLVVFLRFFLPFYIILCYNERVQGFTKKIFCFFQPFLQILCHKGKRSKKRKFPKQRKESTHCFIENKMTKPW